MKNNHDCMTHGEKSLMITIIMSLVFHFLIFWFFQHQFNKTISLKVNEIIDLSSIYDNRRNAQYGILKKEIKKRCILD